jgi:hypothetical protein
MLHLLGHDSMLTLLGHDVDTEEYYSLFDPDDILELWAQWRSRLAHYAPPPEPALRTLADAHQALDSLQRRLEELFGPPPPEEVRETWAGLDLDAVEGGGDKAEIDEEAEGVNSGANGGPTLRKQTYKWWAVGWDGLKRRWVLFKHRRERLREYKHVKGISAGTQHALLMGFVEGRGQLTMKAAKKIAGRTTPCDTAIQVRRRVNPELNHIKNAILEAMGKDRRKAESPFEYDPNLGEEVGGAWMSHLTIGTTTVEEGDLCFVPPEPT